MQLDQQLQALDADLAQRVTQLLQHLSDHPQHQKTLTHLIDLIVHAPPDTAQAKKRKIKTEPVPIQDRPLAILHAISVQHPVRRKLDVYFYTSRIDFVDSSAAGSVLTIQQTSIQQSLSLPTPNKSKSHFTLVLCLKNGECAVIWGVDATDKLDITVDATLVADAETIGKEGKERWVWLLKRVLGIDSTLPSYSCFKPSHVKSSNDSVSPQYHHVICHVKAKDGSLFFLPTGVFFGFKYALDLNV